MGVFNFFCGGGEAMKKGIRLLSPFHCRSASRSQGWTLSNRPLSSFHSIPLSVRITEPGLDLV